MIKRSKCENKGIVPTEMELVLEYTQQGASHEVSDHLKMEMEMEIPSSSNVKLITECSDTTYTCYEVMKDLIKVSKLPQTLISYSSSQVKTVNAEIQLQALLDGKKIIVTKASVRRNLQLNDKEGTDCLPNATIFEELTRMGAKTTAWNEFSSTMASTIIYLATNQKFNFSKYIFESMVKNLDNAGKFLMYLSLKLRVKKLEKKGGSRTYKLKRLYKVGRSARVISSDEASLVIRRLHPNRGGKLMILIKMQRLHWFMKLRGEFTVKNVNLSVDEVTLAQALAALKSAKVQEKANVVEEPSESITTTPTLTTTTAATTITAVSTRPRAKGLVIHEEEQATTPTVSSQQPSQVKAHDKGKGIMVEEPVKMKKKDQISLDEELAFKLQAEEEEEERLAREKAQREEEANIVSWDNVQAMIDADYQMAQQMQAEEQEKLSIEEKSKLFVQLLEARKKHFAAMRAQEERNKPPTKAQKRNTMSTYLKNMAGYKHNQLKNKSFDDIQKLFDKAMKRVNTFVDMDTELVEGSEVRAEGSETRVEGSSKRAGEELEQESSKKQKFGRGKRNSRASQTNRSCF
ncbi:hypothetical protein Tco_0725993 [Tanacetum coccineum]|uniref:Uncharacterized protein n=1 Tax=Tanacetum coccineum TaxID=301880 RepID=A0ABQ4YF95_9ASTR